MLKKVESIIKNFLKTFYTFFTFLLPKSFLLRDLKINESWLTEVGSQSIKFKKNFQLK